MQFDVNGKIIETDEQGFLVDPDDWNEDFARTLAQRDGIELYVDHWELIWYFRDYYQETQCLPTMHNMVLTLGKSRGQRFRDRKPGRCQLLGHSGVGAGGSEQIYGLFPSDPVRGICKLAGLPMPQPDT